MQFEHCSNNITLFKVRLLISYLHHPPNVLHIVNMLVHVQIISSWLQERQLARRIRDEMAIVLVPLKRFTLKGYLYFDQYESKHPHWVRLQKKKFIGKMGKIESCVHTVNPEQTSCAESLPSFLIFCVTKSLLSIAERSRKCGEISPRTSLGIFEKRLVFLFIITHVLHIYIQKEKKKKTCKMRKKSHLHHLHK